MRKGKLRVVAYSVAGAIGAAALAFVGNWAITRVQARTDERKVTHDAAERLWTELGARMGVRLERMVSYHNNMWTRDSAETARTYNSLSDRWFEGFSSTAAQVCTYFGPRETYGWHDVNFQFSRLRRLWRGEIARADPLRDRLLGVLRDSIRALANHMGDDIRSSQFADNAAVPLCRAVDDSVAKLQPAKDRILLSDSLHRDSLFKAERARRRNR